MNRDELHAGKGVVGSLYGGAVPLAIGTSNCVAATLLCYIASGDAVLIAFAVLIGLAGFARLLLGVAYRRARIEDMAALRRWRLLCVVSGSLTTLMLGLLCAYAFYIQNSFVVLAAVSVALANTVGIAARNFNSRAYVIAQCATIGVPLLGAMAAWGSWLEICLGLLYGSYLIAVTSMARVLRNVFEKALTREREVRRSAGQLLTVFETVTSALVMFDADGTAMQINTKAREFLCIPEDIDRVDSDWVMTRIAERMLLGEITTARLRDAFALASHQERTGARSSDPVDMRSPALGSHRLTTSLSFDGQLVVRIDDVSEQRAAQERIRSLSRIDALTGLANRGFFFERAEKALSNARGREPSQPLALAVVDLDDFKHINDTYGHPVGDAILRETGVLIAEAVDPSAICGRFGGDEFVVMAPIAADTPDAATTFARTIARAVNTRIATRGLELEVRGSVGVCASDAIPDEMPSSLDELIARADFAQYAVKNATGSEVCVFAPAMLSQMRRAADIREGLARAIEEQSLHCVFQPVVCARTGRIASAEALVRWTDPVLGIVGPGEFIPIAEEAGLVSALTRTQIHKACHACAGWSGEIAVAVNISAKDFDEAFLIDTVQEALAASGLPPERLILEVTETSILDLRRDVQSILQSIRDLGVRIAIDDFGVGYSSLSYMRRLPFDILKIDRSFLGDIETDPAALSILSAIGSLGRRLGKTTVMEGVETEREMELLTESVPLDYFQGFLFSAPLAERAIRDLLAASVTDRGWQSSFRVNERSVAVASG